MAAFNNYINLERIVGKTASVHGLALWHCIYRWDFWAWMEIDDSFRDLCNVPTLKTSLNVNKSWIVSKSESLYLSHATVPS